MIPLAQAARLAKMSNRNARRASEPRILHRMKLTSLLPLLIAAALAAPFSAQGKDKHDKHDKHDRHDGDKHRDSGKHQDRHDHGHSYSYHSRPLYRYGSSGYYRSSPYYFSSPYYYSRPSIGISFMSRPSGVYRGREVYGSYSDSLAVDVQRELRRRGYYRGSIDGDIGPGSRSAIRAYQYDRGLSATGRIDSSLLRSLGLS